jgi:alpha-maltose-1-phosphate synthase
VVDDETGLLVSFEVGEDELGSPADPDGFARHLAESVVELLEDSDEAQAMGDNGRVRVEQRFSWQAIAAETAELYRRLVSR